MRNFIKKWLEKLEKANKESFGDKPLDCCSVSKSSNPKPANVNRKSK